MKQNLFSFSLSFLNTCNFPIFRNLLKENSLSCTYLWRVSMFRFLSLFLRASDLPELVDLSDLYLSLAFSKLRSTLFTGDFPWSRLRSACSSRWLLSQTEDSFPNFSNRKWHFGAKDLWANHSTFPYFSTILSGHDTRVTWIPFFVQQTTGHRVQVTDLLSYTILTISQCLLIQIQKGKGIDLHFPLSVAYHVTLCKLY